MPDPRVIKTPLPKSSRLWERVQTGDFLDGYAVESTLSPRAAVDLALNMPGWADRLLALRNLIVRPLGLKTGRSPDSAIFPVEHEDAYEVIVGTDDSHLNFRIAVVQNDGRIHMSSWVRPNNLFGRVYLAAVMPFHVLIVRNGMRRIARGPIAPRVAAQ